MSQDINTQAAKAAPPTKKIRFKDPKCKGLIVPNIGTIDETYLGRPAVIRVLKRDPKWFAQHFIEE